MNDVLSFLILGLGIIGTGITLATPYLFAAIGETFVQLSGVYNLGVDGIMLMGAYSGFYVALKTGDLWLGVLTAGVVGGLMGLLMAVISVTLKAEQGISGIGLQLFGLGLSSLLFKMTIGTPTPITGFQPIRIPLLGDIPYVGEAFFNHNILVYIAFLLVPAAAFILNKTTFGLKVRAAGQNPVAADSLGVNINQVRYSTLLLGGVLAGIAGATLSIAWVNLFQENMTNGMGFIAVALVYFGGWRPWGVMGGALLFSLVNAFQFTVQLNKNIAIPYDVLVMLPYILTILALAFARHTQTPAALSKPFERGEN
jgi:general nucleoside transport system permease protein